MPDISIEVGNLDEVHQHAVAAACPIEYGPAIEPWGVKRFYVRDPFGDCSTSSLMSEWTMTQPRPQHAQELIHG